jgi:subtilisin family serine protease
MRFLSFLLAGLLALSAADAAQRVPPEQQKLTLPQGQSGRKTIKPQFTPNVVIPRVCPKGTKGIWPNCTRTGSRKCPTGTTGKWPNCKDIARHCPQGTTGKWPDCKDIARHCPQGTRGKWPDCKTIVRLCPSGTIGKWPNCRDKPVASCAEKGLIGLWPSCRRPEPRRCPDGSAGAWPECSTIVEDGGGGGVQCPSGQVRKGKVCAAVTTGGAGGTPPSGAADAAPPRDISPAIAALTADRPHRPKEILILVAADRASEIAARIARQYDLSAEPRLLVPLIDGAIVRLRFTGNRSVESVLQAVSADPDVQLVQPNYDYRASKDKTPPQAAPQYAGEKLRLDEAHRQARGKGVMIAVIDTAIDGAHPELAGAIAGMFDAVGEGPARPEQHGTEIAGILAAHATLKGVAPDAKLLSVRAFRGGGSDPALSTSFQLLKGINWAFASGAKIMNMSFAGPMDPLLERIIKNASAKGAIFIAAAGNNGPKGAPAYPAAYPEVIAVTATDEKDRLYGKANRGDYVFIAAPGVDIVAPVLKGGYDLSSGTSMAAAHVSGVVALLLERDGKLDGSGARAILSKSARKPDPAVTDEAFGAGIVDAAGALSEDGKEAGLAAPSSASDQSGER